MMLCAPMLYSKRLAASCTLYYQGVSKGARGPWCRPCMLGSGLRGRRSVRTAPRLALQAVPGNPTPEGQTSRFSAGKPAPFCFTPPAQMAPPLGTRYGWIRLHRSTPTALVGAWSAAQLLLHALVGRLVDLACRVAAPENRQGGVCPRRGVRRRRLTHGPAHEQYDARDQCDPEGQHGEHP